MIGCLKIWLHCHPCIENIVNDQLQLCIQKISSRQVLEMKNLSDFRRPLRFSIRGLGSQQFLIDALSKLQRIASTSSSSASLNLMNTIVNSHNSMSQWFDGEILACNIPDIRLAFTSIYMYLSSSHNSGIIGAADKGKQKFFWPNPLLVDSALWQIDSRAILSSNKLSSHDLQELVKDFYSYQYYLSSIPSTSPSQASYPSNINGQILDLCGNCNIPFQLIRKISTSISCPHTGTSPSLSSDKKWLQSTMSGYDIVLPESWGRLFLRYALSWSGSMLAGLEEMDYLYREAGMLSYPRDYLDTQAGLLYWQQRYQDIVRREERRPPQKRRINALSSIKTFYELMLSRYPFDAVADNGGASELVAMRSELYVPAIDLASILTSALLSWSDGMRIEEICPSLPELPYPTIVNVSIHATGRGVPRDGDVLYVPPVEAYLAWLYHHQHRKNEVIVGSKRRRLAEWHGCRLRSDTSKLAMNHIVGVVTSGLNPLLSRTVDNNFHAIAVCDAKKLYESQRQAVVALIKQSSNQMKMEGSQHLTLYEHLRSNSYKLVLFHRLGSSWLRPALLKIITTKP
jgi:hypothetical protein